MPDLQSVQTELADLVFGLRHAQDMLAQATSSADERTRELRAKIEELEAQNLERAFRIRELEQENAELRRQMAERPLDRGRALAEDEDALAVLERARRVIEDSLQMRQVLSHTTASRTESDGDLADRPQRPVAGTSVAAMAPHMPEDTRSATPGSSQETVSSISSVHVLSDAPSSASRGKRKAKEPQWSLEFHSPPRTMEVQRGRIPFNYLAELLRIDEEAQHNVASLKTMPGFDIRIFNESDIAFLYQPVILEGPKVTYLIGWGDEEMVRHRESWAKTLGDMHLFTCPDEDPGWFYTGLHSLTFAKLDNVWSKLQKEDKQKLQAQLKERNPGLDTGGFRRDAREGRLVQCCLQLESKGKAESLDFLREYGLLGSEG